MTQTFLAYLRVSTNSQGASGLGIEAQRDAVRRYVQNVGGNLAGEYVEVESGARSARPVLAQLTSRCRQERAVLLIARLDRLSRSVSFISSLIESRVDFVAADNPAANKTMLQMLAVFAEYERDQIAARTKAALAAAKARGVELGKHGKVLAIQRRHEATSFAETLRSEVVDILTDYGIGTAQVAERLNMRGLRTRTGEQWRAQTAHRLLRRLHLKTEGMAARAKGARLLRRRLFCDTCCRYQSGFSRSHCAAAPQLRDASDNELRHHRSRQCAAGRAKGPDQQGGEVNCKWAGVCRRR